MDNIESELRSKTIVQLKAIIKTHEQESNKRFTIPTRKDDIIQFIINNNIYKQSNNNNNSNSLISSTSTTPLNDDDSNSLTSTTTSTTCTTSSNNTNTQTKKRSIRDIDDQDDQDDQEDQEEQDGDEDMKDEEMKQDEMINMVKDKIILFNDSILPPQPYKLMDMSDLDNKLKGTIKLDDIDKMFQYYFGGGKLTIEQFISTYFPGQSTTKCPTYLFRRYYFICLTCSKSNERTNFCVECFMAGDHIKDNHNYSLAASPIVSCLCDCGNPDTMKREGFCPKHRNADDDLVKKQDIEVVPEDVRQAFRTFFSKLVAHAASKGSSTKRYKANENEIADVITYLGKSSTKSPLIAKIIAEEMTCQRLEPESFDVANPIQLRITTNNNNNNNKKSKNIPPVVTLFTSHLNFTTKCFYLFAVLSYHHKMFAEVFYQLYLTHQSMLMLPQPKVSLAESCFHFQMYYQHPSSIIVPFASGRAQPSLYDVVLQSTRLNLEAFYPAYVINRPQSKSCRYDTIMLVKSVRFLECALYLANSPEVINGIIDLCVYVHQFTTPSQNYENVLRELKDLIQVESNLINTFGRVVKQLSSSGHGSELVEKETKMIKFVKNVIDKVLESFDQVRYPSWYDEQVDIGTRFIFPLPRIIAIILLQQEVEIQNQLIAYVGQKIAFPCKYIDLTLCDIASFRIFFYAHCSRPRLNIEDLHIIAAPTDEERHIKYYTKKTMMLDFFSLQIILAHIHPSDLLRTALDRPFLKPTGSSDIVKSCLEFIINIIQSRPTLNPTDQDLKYHYIQAASTGYFYFTDMVNFKFIFKNVKKEKRIEIIKEVVVDLDAEVMTLKPTLWGHYDPYYWYFEYYYRVILQDRSRNLFMEYQKSKGIPESHPYVPPTLPAHPNPACVQGIMNFVNDSSLTEVIHFIMLKILETKNIVAISSEHSIFDLSKHSVFSKLTPSSIVLMGDLLYLLVLCINTNYTTNNQEYINHNNNIRFTTKYSIQFDDGTTKEQSLLMTLVQYWKMGSDDQQNPLLVHIIGCLASTNRSMANFLIDQGIGKSETEKKNEDIEKEKKKKMLQLKREEILKQMKEKQNQFLNESIDKQDQYDDDDEQEEINNQNNNNQLKSIDSSSHSSSPCCIICRDKNNTSPLYMMARVTHCSLTRNQKLVSIRRIMRQLPEGSSLKKLLEVVTIGEEDDEVIIGILYNKDMLSNEILEQFPSLLRFFTACYELPSYISSCQHVTHRACIIQSTQNGEHGYNCPLCSSHSNILIPTNARNLSIEEVSQFFLSFQSEEEDMQNTVFERHLWAMVFNNFEVLEMKSRRLTYLATPSQLPDGYFVLTDLEFKNELETLCVLYNIIMSCEVPPFPEDQIPLPPIFLYQLDPIFLTTYCVYLRRMTPTFALSSSIQYYLFNYLLLESLSNISYSNLEVQDFNQLDLIESMKSLYNSLDNDDGSRLEEYMLPMLRKVYLYNFISTNQKQQPTLSQFNDRQYLLQHLESIGIPKLYKDMLPINQFNQMLKESFDLFITKQNFTFQLPSSINHIPKFIKLHLNYINFIKKHIPLCVAEEPTLMCGMCLKVRSCVCLCCSALVCTEDCVESFLAHPKSCPSGVHQVFYFIEITTGLVKVVDIDKSVILYNNDIVPIYVNERNEPSTMTNNQLTLSNSRLQLIYKKWIQMASTNTFNSLDQDFQLF